MAPPPEPPRLVQPEPEPGHVTVAVHVPNNSTSTQNSNGEADSSSSKKTSKKQPGGKTEPIPKGLEAEELKDGDKAPGSARRILQEAWPFRASLAVGTVYLVLGSIFFMSLPFFAGKLLDTVAEGQAGTTSVRQARRKVNGIVLQLLVATGLSAVFTALRSTVFNGTAEKVVGSVRKKVFDSLLRQEVAFFDAVQTGALLSRLGQDTEALKNAATVNISIFLRSAASATVGLVLMFVTSWRLTLLSLAVMPVMSFSLMIYGRYVRTLSAKTSKQAAIASSIASDILAAMRTVVMFVREEHEMMKYAGAVDETVRLGILGARAGGIFSFCATLMSVGSMSGVFWYGSILTIEGKDGLTLGSLQAFVLYAVTIAASVGMMASVFFTLLQAMGSSARVFELIDRVPIMNANKDGPNLDQIVAAGERKGTSALSAELHQVTFAYPSRPDSKVLSGCSIRIEPGETLAIVGPSGGGKSTISLLMARFYDPQEGKVLVGGANVADLDLAALRRIVGMVAQEPAMFARTLLENIAFGVCKEASEVPFEDVKSAATLANAHSFIEGYPEGYETYVGERGVQLSGGQRQRVAIARAVLSDPKLLMLDEATSALDAESEHLVTQALERLMIGRTSMVIAHRLSTIREADQIVVLESGSVAEKGTHEDLIGMRGAYFALVKRQMTAGGSSVVLADDAE